MAKKDRASSKPYAERPYFRHRLRGMEDAEALNASLLTPLFYQNRSGYPLDMCFEGGGGRELSLFKTTSSTGFRTSTIYEMDIITIRFVLQGRLSRHNPHGDIVAKAGLGLLLPFSTNRHEETSLGYEAVAAVIDRKTFESHLHALEGWEGLCLPDFATVVDTCKPGITAFLSSLLATQKLIGSGAPADDIITPLLQEVLIYQFLGAWPRLNGQPPAPQTFAPPRKLRTALDFIESHLCSKLRVSDVAAACGMSVRNLQFLFKRETGKSIVQTINDLRLDRVQRDLREDPTLLISQVAYRWGFLHMGDFSQRYRERFGHLPSETRRGRGDTPQGRDVASRFIDHMA
ncbi:MAG: helix-turn-helix transcriptional regulator [Fulvimarina manganoxydans]|uniref:helix-turn-helix transcriptional regulator n=1 Tax=Fulvimarina manganoxydans TaxID=937218 RepID=UPI0023533CB9|nr:helix-turn-helix transcriptional regulator [Fulvimarina manganoxydans]MCK5932563.1 helix-turn-helix transcriptional regulator [Fulvimarina manganoxydans]